MKILYIAGESANWVINLCNEFCKAGHEVTCVVQQLDEYDKDNPVKEHPNLKRINVDYNTMFNHFMLEKEIENIKDYDVIFGSHAPISIGISYIASKYNKPWGVMLLDIPTDLMLYDSNRMANWNAWFKHLKYADQIIFNTKVARDEYKKYVGKEFDDDHVIMYATHVPENYQLLGQYQDEGYVVSAFRLTQAKNGSMITKALATMKNPLTQVVIGRDRGDLQNIIKIAQDNNILVEAYNGTVTEDFKFKKITGATCLVYPQLSEYIGGLSPWEGMMIGKPVVVSDYKVLRDMFGEHAIYVNPTSPEDVARGIEEAKNYDKEKLLDAYDYAMENATFKVMASKMLKIFETMVRK